ncbi:RICIN domain-containing protein [Streptomyces sp. ME18-1-4]|uniref:RICIN domain-containing protein n=1 Tax=Streptomyces sp. ME18-1-4 TaxID=3028685 RepID=UPI0029CA73DD|nr:RICIN domain-containing protein [Streptomyces sp. ME18-1-4]
MTLHSPLSQKKWTLTDAGNGYYGLKNVNSGLNAGVAQSSTVDGASVVQWNDLNVDDQLWKIVRIN